MSTYELVMLARRRGLVQWKDSGTIERLYVGKRTRRVYAVNLLTRKYHSLFLKSDDWRVREVQPNENVRLGDLLPKQAKKVRQP